MEKIQNSRKIQWFDNKCWWLYSYSVAIHDALKIIEIPIIELHISNIYNREDFRHKSLISKIAKE